MAEEKTRPKPKSKPRPVHSKHEPIAAPTRTPEAAATAWPGSATSVSESYGEWTMTCARPGEKAACVVAQSQGDSKTGRRKFGIELKRPQEGHEGVVVMPFRLAIESGITFQLDDQVLGKGAPYINCTGEGCLLPINFSTTATDAMRTARTLIVIG